MITDRTYYKGEIYIPGAKPSATTASSSSIDEINSFIDEFEEECLVRCLGPNLYRDFLLNIDLNDPTLIDPNSAAKWDDLMNGRLYTCPYTPNDKNWRGLRFKMPTSGDEYNRSLLAYYVYYFYEQKQYITNTGTGHQIEEAKNAETVTPTNKVVNAWRKFVKMTQGSNTTVDIHTRNGLIGVDYANNNNTFVSLYEYITDMNVHSEGTYANFEPETFELINNFGL